MNLSVTLRSWAASPFFWILALVTLFFGGVLCSSASFFGRDLLVFQYPLKMAWCDAWSQGRPPLWNPGLHLGMPFVGDLVTAAWYPLNALFLFMPGPAAVKFFVVIHFLLAAAGAGLVARELGCTRYGTILAGVSYALSGYLISVHFTLTYLSSAAWAAWVLWAWSRSHHKNSFSAIPVAALCMSMLIVVGDPMLFAEVSLALGLYLVWTAKPGKRLIIGFARLGAVVAGAIGLAAAQWIPAWELFHNSTRATGLSLEEAVSWSFDPQRLLDFVLPFRFGSAFPWPHGLPLTELPWADTHYLGLLTISLALTGFLIRRDRINGWLLSLVILFTWLALGDHTPLYRWALAATPALQSLRYPEKFMVVVALALCLSGGRGLDSWLQERKARSRFLVAAIPILALILTWILPEGLEPAQFFGLKGYGISVHVALVVACFGTLWLLFETGRLSRHRFSAALLSMAFLDLWVVCGYLLVTGPADLFRLPPPIVETIRKAAGDSGLPYRVFVDPRLSAMVPSVTRLGPEVRPRYWEVRAAADLWRVHPNTGLIEGMQYVTGYSPLEPADRIHVAHPPQESAHAVLDLVNARVVIAPSDGLYPASAGYDVIYDSPELKFRVLRNRDAFPRAFLLTEDSATRYLGNRPAPLECAPLELLKGATCRIDVHSAEDVRLSVSSTSPGYLVLSDRFFPGWSVQIDQRPGTILRFAGVLRSVHLSAGQHRVQFLYRPATVGWGILISTLTAAGLFATFLLGRRQTQNRSERPGSTLSEPGAEQAKESGLPAARPTSDALPTRSAAKMWF